MKDGVGRVFFSMIVGVRVMYGMVSGVADCDEVFNYWEPAHELIYGRGLQTWEYSPEYGLRSWLYVWLNCGLGWVLAAAGVPKTTVFMAIRSVLALCSGYADCSLITSVQSAFGSRLAYLLGALLVCSTGCSMASFCFLPSSFALMCITAAQSQQLQFGRRRIWKLMTAVALVVAAVVVGWPFIGLACVPLGLHALYVYGLPRTFLAIAVCTAVMSYAVFFVDTLHYGRPVMSTWEIVKYNVLGCLPREQAPTDLPSASDPFATALFQLGCVRDTTGSRGAHLYGVEDWTFFYKNLFLNFNIAFVAALAAPPLIVARFALTPAEATRPGLLLTLWYVLPFFLWFGFWLLIPHKEERFMAPVYGVLCLAAALGVEATVDLIDYMMGATTSISAAREVRSIKASHVRWAASVPGRLFLFAFMAVFVGLCVSRNTALTTYYSAPLGIMYETSALTGDSDGDTVPLAPELYGERFAKTTITLCIGREWYRFMSHFFVPSTVVLGFIDDGFEGLLPKYFGPAGTSSVPGGMNDVNRKDPNQFVPLETCDYIVASEFPSDDVQNGPSYLRSGNWTKVESLPFLDAQKTPTLHRTFILPSFIPGDVVYGSLLLLERTSAT